MAGKCGRCVVSHKAAEGGSPAAAGTDVPLPTVLPRKSRNGLLQLEKMHPESAGYQLIIW